MKAIYSLIKLCVLLSVLLLVACGGGATPAPTLLSIQAAAPNVMASQTRLVITFSESMNTVSLSLSGTLAAESLNGIWSTTTVENDTLMLIPQSANGWSTGTGKDITINVNDVTDNNLATITLTYSVYHHVYYVSSAASDDSGGGLTIATAKKTIMAAINTASSNDVVVITGTHLVNSASTVNTQIVLKEGVSLLGGFNTSFSEHNVALYPTVIRDTVPDATNNITPVNRAMEAGAGITNATIVDGLSITGGTPRLGAAFYAYSGAAPRIQRCIIDAAGNGFTEETSAVYSNDAAPVIQNSVLHGGVGALNSVGVYNTGASAATILRNNTIYAGSSSGAFTIRTLSGGAVTIENNIVFNNDLNNLPCILNQSGSLVSLRNNVFFSCSGSGGLYQNSGVLVYLGLNGAGNLTANADGSGTILSASTGNSTIIGAANIASIFVDMDGADNDINTLDDNNWQLSTSVPNNISLGGLNGVDEGWGFSVDYTNATRAAAGSPWSIGAFENTP